MDARPILFWTHYDKFAHFSNIFIAEMTKEISSRWRIMESVLSLLRARELVDASAHTIIF